MKKILVNDGMSSEGINILEEKKFFVETKHVPQDKLIQEINSNQFEALVVRSATKVDKAIIDGCENLKMIIRGGVGMDNIDVEYAEKKGILVFNTTSSSSTAVAELVFAHLASMTRFLHLSNRLMPLEGEVKFKDLKKSFSNGTELKNKTLGIIGFGRIGQELARIGIGVGMNIIAHDLNIKKTKIELKFFNGQTKEFEIKTTNLKEVLSQSDFISVHVPKLSKKAIIGTKEIQMMKKNAFIINTARGGVIDENALMLALEKGTISCAALDVYENEPNPSIHLMMQHNISLSPHIGAATIEAQKRIGIEVANLIIAHLK